MVVMATVAIGLLVSTIFIINKVGTSLVLDESIAHIEESGNHIVEDLVVRTTEIASLVRTIATTVKHTEKDPSLYHQLFPPIYDFNGDQNIAGGGIWPEPFEFDENVERNSFFWGRDTNGEFQFYDDYNKATGKGYHHEEWYVVSRYLESGRCFWSKSYMDPYSLQPMVTCTVGTYQDKKLTGTVTVDLKLEGLDEWINRWQKKIGGYIILLDRNDKFISFPKAGEGAKAYKNNEINGSERIPQEMKYASTFADEKPLFKPISDKLREMGKDILLQAKLMPNYNQDIAKKIDEDSYQINAQEAELISAVILDPMKKNVEETRLYKTFHIEKDPYTGTKSIVFLFHVPSSYWKVAIVKPYSEAIAVSTNLIEDLAVKIGAIIILLICLGYFLLRQYLVRPLENITISAQEIDELIMSGRTKEIGPDKFAFSKNKNDEVGILSSIFLKISTSFLSAQEIIEKQNTELEKKVKERTNDLEDLNKDLGTVLKKLHEEIDEHEKVKKVLEKSEKKYKDLFEKSDDAVLIISNERFVDCNQATVRMLRYKNKKDLLETHPSELSPEKQSDGRFSFEKAEEMMDIAIKQGSHRFEWDHKRSDGEVFPVEVLLTTISNIDGKPILHTVWRDITERKKIEEDLKETNRTLKKSMRELKENQEQLILAEKMASLGGLVAGLAHEINTPIGIGVTASSFLAEQTRSANKNFKNNELRKSDLEGYFDEATRSSTMILNNLQRASQLITSFKMVSADQTSEEKREFELKSYISEILNSLQAQTKRSKVEISINASEAISIYSVPGTFAQIITNFIINSIQHAFDDDIDGEITIDLEKNEKNLFVKYHDNGKGIPEKYMAKIFDPFFTTKRGEGGTGLGLHIVFNIIHKNLGGKISCESKPENGTTFLITIPLKNVLKK